MQSRSPSAPQKFTILEPSHPRLASHLAGKTECSLCPITLRSKFRSPGLRSPTDNYFVISDLPVYFRLPQDYARDLIDSKLASNVASSILQLPWLCLEGTTKGFGLKGTLIKNLSGLFGDMEAPFLDLPNNTSENNKYGLDSLEYFLEMEINHPISDKPIYSMTFGSKMQANGELGPIPETVTYDDALSVGELRKNFLDTKEILVPDTAFLLHLQLSVPLLARKKSYSCLAYCSAETLSSKELFDPSNSEFVIALFLDSECRLSLSFKPFLVDVSSETGLAALHRLFPNEQIKTLSQVRLPRFILVETECECLFPQGELYLADPTLQYLGSTQQHKSTSIKDSYTVNNTQNNYYFNNEPRTAARFYPQMNDNWSNSKSPKGEAGEWLQNTTHSAGNVKLRKSFKTGNEVDKTSTNGNGYHSEDLKGENEGDSASESLEEKDSEGFPLKAHTLEEILRDSRLFKRYANSKSKNPLIQNLVTSLNSEQTTGLLETLRPLVRDICKHKYGNYIIQVLAKSLPNESVIPFLTIVLSPDAAPTTLGRDHLPPQRHVCDPGHHRRAEGPQPPEVLRRPDQDGHRAPGQEQRRKLHREGAVQALRQAAARRDHLNISLRPRELHFRQVRGLHLQGNRSQACERPPGPQRAAQRIRHILPRPQGQHFLPLRAARVRRGTRRSPQVFHQTKAQSPELASLLLDFVKNPRNLFRSRATAETILMSVEKPPTEVSLADADVQESPVRRDVQTVLPEDPGELQGRARVRLAFKTFAISC